ncbi:MAG TPA: hypothetical protein IAA44_04920 [Candidatus Blautia avistercoris]|nr:hypothetical protein [Candidatus Blautia avistercoris]
MKTGSVTVFLALITTVILALTAASIQSVKNAAYRVQILNGMDIGLYSLFAQYDKDMLEEYHLLFIDGTWGGSQLNIGRICDEIQSYMEPVLEQNHASMKISSLGLTGYTLAADQNGQPFYQQAVEYMKETAGIQAVKKLWEKAREETQSSLEGEELWESANENETMEEYEIQMQEAASAQAEEEEPQEETTLPAEPVENPIPVIREIQNMGILDLVLKDPGQVSRKETDEELLSAREQETGMNPQTEAEDGAVDKMLFQEYLFQICGDYLSPGQGKLDYQMEYILFGRESDIENLKAAANRILLIREGLNFAYLLGDPAKKGAAQALAASLAAAILFPPAEPVIEAALLLCWAFAESIVDMRMLFQGQKVPVVKSSASWQTSLEGLTGLLGNWGEEKTGEEGIGYEDYLKILLLLQSREKMTIRAMDVVEMEIRNKDGKETFRLDCCIGALEAEAAVESDIKTYQINRSYGYGN